MSTVELEAGMSGRLRTNAEVEKFTLAGNATITIVSHVTGRRYTFKVSKPQDFKVERPIWFVKVLTGDDNEHDYSYLGEVILSGAAYAYRRGRRSAESLHGVSDTFQWFWRHVTERDALPAALEVWHEGKCGRCGRKLTVPESIASGFGPECINYV